MLRGKMADARVAMWDHDREAIALEHEPGAGAAHAADGVAQHSWLIRQLIAMIWILIAWAVGTLVFELGAVG